MALREPKMRVELDKKALFALASDTRLDILKSLQPMRRTVTQLAESLGIDKAAIHRHLKTLEQGGFVKRYEDHGFVYYGLSWKSRDLLSPNENTRVVILLAAFVAVIGVAVLLIAAASSDVGILDQDRGEYSSSDSDEPDGVMAADAVLTLPIILAVSMMSVISVLVLRRAVRIVRRPRQPGMVRDDID